MLLVTIAFLHGALTLRTMAQERPPATPDIAGTWTLNREASDRGTGSTGGDGKRERGRRGGPPQGRGGGGMRGGGGGTRGEADGGGRKAPDRDAMKAVSDILEEISTPSTRLIVMQRDPTHVTIVAADGHTRSYSTTADKEPHQLTSGTIQTRTRWEDGQLVIAVATDRGPLVVQSYRLDAEHHRLLMTLRIDESRDRRLPGHTFVYEAAAEP